jgi:hypothetical protein
MRSNTAAVLEGVFHAHATSNIYICESTCARSARSPRIPGQQKRTLLKLLVTPLQPPVLLEGRFKRHGP